MPDKPRKHRLNAPTRKPTTTVQPAVRDETDASEKAYIESLIASGRAAKPDAHGKLPPGATHEIIETDDGKLKVIRRRFSAF